MSWSDRYIGLPYREFGRSREGCDCWGLVKVIYREQVGIPLPDYLGYTTIDERGEIAALVAGATASPLWQRVSGTVAPLDVAVFRRGRFDSHVGVIVRPGLMIHTARGDAAKIEDIRTGAWARRLTGFYRHVEMVFRTAQSRVMAGELS